METIRGWKTKGAGPRDLPLRSLLLPRYILQEKKIKVHNAGKDYI